MKRDLGFTFTIIVGMATFAIALVAGIFLIWETGGSPIAQEPEVGTLQVTFDVQRGPEPSRL
jgi:hypothetical protein